MTATTESPSPPVEAPRLGRAEGIELLGEVAGSGYKAGAALVRRSDGQMVQLGPLMYALLENIDGRRTPAELAAILSDTLDRGCDEEHVVALAEKLAAQGLLAGSEHKAPPRRNPLLALRWKVLVTNPAITRRITAPFTVLFEPWVMWPVVACFVGVCWFVLFHKGVASATSDAFRSPELLLLVLALAIVSAGFHEIGHAAACRRGGATPGGMGMGLYMVWPAFYTDVTDAYRLPRRDRLRVDLGGIYFNAIVAVATLGVWLLWRADALLLVIALQLLMMVKNLSPVIRSDGYHILSDATGVPDLYAHLLPTLKRLIPGHGREPSALTGRARLLVTTWVLVIVPVLLSMMFAAVILLPRLATTAWDSGRTIAVAMPHQSALGILASCVRLVALALPVLGSAYVTQRIVRSLVGRGRSWSRGRPIREGALVLAGAGIACCAAWAWWPAGQYQPVRASERGTLVSFVAAPTAAARPVPQPAPLHLTPGTHLAVSMIPVGGATKAHPALYVIPGHGDDPAVAILSDATPDPTDPAATTTDSTTTEATTTTTTAGTTTTATSGPAPVTATAFPFKLPSKPGPGGTQAVALGTKDGGVTYDVAYSLVTVSGGAPVTNTNSAFALASCNACTTVAVSFQVVLIVGQTNRIAPINAAVAANADCPACVTTAIADQIVVTLTKQPTADLVAKLQDALKQLGALSQLGAAGTPAAIAAAVEKVQEQIDSELKDSGLLANPTTTTATATTGTVTGTTPTTTATASTGATTAAGTATTASTTTARASTTTTTSTTTARTTTTTPTTTTQTTGTTPTTTAVTTTEATTTG